MKPIYLLLTLLALLIPGGCATDPAVWPASISFVPEITDRLNSGTSDPVQLTATEREEVCDAIRGSLHREFCNDQMEEEMYASWWYIDTNGIAIVRWKKDRSEYMFIAFDQNGNRRGDGGGHDLDFYSPWIK